ncbi:hypothetical protein [Haloplanus rubicundus]|uniref:Uncharacterized protein n=1 Tax=Haloplanus rubicundus TaxID=1547898 RepID=A0A345EBR0_9EURY|nr:hypothetical protein [Haloplanus rubicundus]AXG09632.1 hypothetical protein DU484_06965 [Haloplanus rubicundus]
MVGGGSPAPFEGVEGVTPPADGRVVAGAVRAVDGPAEAREAVGRDERRGVANVVEGGGGLVDGVGVYGRYTVVGREGVQGRANVGVGVAEVTGTDGRPFGVKS